MLTLFKVLGHHGQAVLTAKSDTVLYETPSHMDGKLSHMTML